MNNFFLAFFSDINHNHKNIIDSYNSIKVFNLKLNIKRYKLKFQNILLASKYYIILNKYNKLNFSFLLNNFETLLFIYYNNNFYNVLFLNKLAISIKLNINKNYLYLYLVFKSKFTINIIKYIAILKRRRCQP
jgi:hypothetical protein